MDVRVGLWRKLSTEELMLLNCGVGEDSCECLGLRPVLGVHWRDWCSSWNSNTLATWCEELIHWKRPWCWEGLGAGAEGDNRGWDGWIASPTWWMWVWVNSGSWWWTGEFGMLQSMGIAKSQTWLSDWTELNWTDEPNIGAPQYTRQTLTDIKGEIDSNTIIVGDFNTHSHLWLDQLNRKLARKHKL